MKFFYDKMSGEWERLVDPCLIYRNIIWKKNIVFRIEVSSPIRAIVEKETSGLFHVKKKYPKPLESFSSYDIKAVFHYINGILINLTYFSIDDNLRNFNDQSYNYYRRKRLSHDDSLKVWNEEDDSCVDVPRPFSSSLFNVWLDKETPKKVPLNRFNAFVFVIIKPYDDDDHWVATLFVNEKDTDHLYCANFYIEDYRWDEVITLDTVQSRITQIILSYLKTGKKAKFLKVLPKIVLQIYVTVNIERSITIWEKEKDELQHTI